MWLLDVNVDLRVVDLLLQRGIKTETTLNLGWRELSNGNLVKAATQGGFQVLLTRDVDFAKSAAKALQVHPNFCVILLKIPQSRRQTYLNTFASEWNKSHIQPQPGQLVEWPKAQ